MRKVSVDKKDYACKEILFQEENIWKEISIVLKEYMISKIADHIEAGPSIRKPFLYDMIVFENKAVFFMEIGSQYRKN